MRHTAIPFKVHTKPSCFCNVVDNELISRRGDNIEAVVPVLLSPVCQRVLLCSAYRVICPRRRTYWFKITLAPTGVVMSVKAA